MNLIIDQGNTRTKLALFENGILRKSTALEVPLVEEILRWLNGTAVRHAIISSVVGDELFKQLKSRLSFPIVQLSHKTPIPFHNKYATPSTLGLDRIALVAGAVAAYPKQNCLVIDAGTCITYDFVNSHGEYLGGAISPGVQMRLKAMNHFTARLPLANVSDVNDFIGTTTLESLGSGAVHGAINEVAGTINKYESRFPDMITALTGGDLRVFDGLLKNSIFAAPELLLWGLNNILDQHAEML